MTAHRGSAALAILLFSAVALVALAVPPVGPAPATAAARPAARTSSSRLRPVSTTAIAGWSLVGHYTENSLDAGEGVATVTGPGGTSTELYRGLGTIPAAISAQGWSHVGDPDSDDGIVIDAYQGSASGDQKMYLVTEPTGRTEEYVHTLVAGELYNNSFVAIAPGGQWMVSGEWGVMNHLQIYPTPTLNAQAPRTGGALDLAGEIELDHEVNDVQGCAFASATELLCATTGDPKLFTNPLPFLEITLRHALNGHSVPGHVVDLGSLPEQSACRGTFEAEGVDVDHRTGVVRAEVIQPGYCELATIVYEYKATHRH